MRPAIKTLLEALLARSRADGGVHIDDFGAEVTMVAIGNAEIEELIAAFEDGGGIMHAPDGGGHTERLKLILAAARELAPRLGRPARPRDIAEHLGIDVALVRAALAVGRIMGR